MEAKGLKIVIRCGDLAASRSFYGEILGLPVVDEWQEAHGDGCVFAVATSFIELGERGGEAGTGPKHFDIEILVDDLDSWLGRIGDRWQHSPAKMQPWGERTSRLHDPDGNLVVLYEEAGP